MIGIDGSYGEGGGQILRTSLALSLITGEPFKIENIRAGRRKTGLMRQHLTALNAAAEIGNAEITGNKIGSKSFSFKPGAIKAGKYHFNIGSAGSCTLVLQAILPALIIAGDRSEILLEGGTHNPFAPTYDFLEKVFLPIISKMGAEVITNLEIPGFYPAGGGKMSVKITPAKKLLEIDLSDRGKILNRYASAMVSNVPYNVAERELKVVKNKLILHEEDLEAIVIKNSSGPGNVLAVAIESETITELITAFGERGLAAERVAKKTIKPVKDYLSSGAVVGKHLADQLLVPMAVAGAGRFRTMSPSRHTMTNIDIVKKFINVDIEIIQIDEKCFDIVIGEK